MKLTIERLTQLQSKENRVVNPVNLFNESNSHYISEYQLYAARFNAIPNFAQEIRINCDKAVAWLLNTHPDEVKDIYFNQMFFGRNGKPEVNDVYCFIDKDLMIYFSQFTGAVKFLFRQTNPRRVEFFIASVRKFKNRRTSNSPRIYLITSCDGELKTISAEILCPALRIEEYYNNDFKEFHQIIFDRLNKKGDKGLVLLHGKPGTGKTTYIRYLVSTVKKDVIFLPPHMAANLTAPTLLRILIDNPNSILIIEDAESLILDRGGTNNSSTSTLLNITDGLLSDFLNVQIICTFNTQLSRIDHALLRKGRLIGQYEFKELGVGRAQRLSDSLGFNSKIEKPMTLTEIYNQGQPDFQLSRRYQPVGFQVK